MRKLLLSPILLFMLGLVWGVLDRGAVPVAQACKCASAPMWKLQFEELVGDGDVMTEEQAWQAQAWLYANDELGQTGTLSFGEDTIFEWRRAQ